MGNTNKGDSKMRKPSNVIGEALCLYSHSRQFLCHIIEDNFPRVEAEAAKSCIMREFPDNVSLGSHLVNHDPIFACIRHDSDIPSAEKEVVLWNMKRAWFLNLIEKLQKEGK
jgi:hypothetical protein